MATYAAFKHVELHKVGFGKNRVPTAPRGCISEIFNGADGPSRRHVNGNSSTNGIGVSTVDSPAKKVSPIRPRDTHSRLFGGPLPPPPPAVRNDTTRSNIQFGDATDGAQSQARSTPVHSNGYVNGVSNGIANGVANGHIATPKKGDISKGNPVTGDGYKSMNGEINMSITALNGNAMPINHNRIPPGGYSSGLW